MDIISEKDVLCGRGGLTNSHTGNKKFRTTVARHTHEYLQAHKKEKSQIARKIVSQIKEEGGRFLKRGSDNNTWVEVPDKKALEKTLQALREGLDVRHKTFRPEKMPRLDDDAKHESNRTRAKLVRGRVIGGTSSHDSFDYTNKRRVYPGTASPSTDDDEIPELKDESFHEDDRTDAHGVESLRMYFEPPRISQSECNDIAAV
eukprot:CAMPEP_0176004808 /NCGR_PEP_ID=MMETSP0120_2-20121206/1883_1 /TAXON_ID=160619 /ORGANISM="Kryptoperidinium foliaceum, Strain CCMP 1326" /LENGTH=202 /DNA_ID=CAMNT_0017337499 /DNA_START=109 /DNA_END=717 /DNA_ORIENTATION=-